MALGTNLEQLRDELVDACASGEEARARALVLKLGEQPRKARALLEALLQAPDSRARQAAAFGLGELGGPASTRRLEQQLVLEEARGDHDGSSVAEAITLALGRIEGARARASLIRRLERLASDNPNSADVNVVAYELWKRRHPDLLPSVRKSLERIALPTPNVLNSLLILMEKAPDELSAWALSPSVPIEDKTGVLALLEEELPEALIVLLPAFISVAHASCETVPSQKKAAVYYCERLCSVLIKHKETVLSTLPSQLRSELRDMARKMIVATAPNSSLRAALLLQFVGQSEDAALLEAHHPAEPILARAFDETVKVLRDRQGK
ncbi:HEAT repeat domain-containing protein [Cystobacter fuscus]|uniref:HEAT repeat domain-containing protein n=1 Tax=Cystobacter fuscus TaxID=43 RepID=UPI002B2AC87B|nr:HEAT repeat domain-containing protein [Cystobacter fuscus]